MAWCCVQALDFPSPWNTSIHTQHTHTYLVFKNVGTLQWISFLAYLSVSLGFSLFSCRNSLEAYEIVSKWHAGDCSPFPVVHFLWGCSSESHHCPFAHLYKDPSIQGVCHVSRSGSRDDMTAHCFQICDRALCNMVCCLVIAVSPFFMDSTTYLFPIIFS